MENLIYLGQIRNVINDPQKFPSVYDFDSFATWLANVINFTKRKNKRFSIKSLSVDLKIKSPSSLTMILRGQRMPTLDLAYRVATYFELSKSEEKFLDALVRLQRAANDADRARLRLELNKMRPSASPANIRLNAIDMLSKWYVVVILEMTRVSSFFENYERIATLLGSTVTPEMVESAIVALKTHKLVVPDKNGIIRKSAAVLKTTTNIPSLAIRSFHKQILSRAHAALDKQSVDERYFSSLTLAIPHSKVKSAGEHISRFRDEFMAEMAVDNVPPEEIYHLAIQFFRATDTRLSDKSVRF